jgi:hypothetical protein
MYIINENITENTSILTEQIVFNLMIFTWCIVIIALYQYFNSYRKNNEIKYKYF